MVVYNDVMHRLSPGILDKKPQADHHFDHIDRTKISVYFQVHHEIMNRQKKINTFILTAFQTETNISMKMSKESVCLQFIRQTTKKKRLTIRKLVTKL